MKWTCPHCNACFELILQDNKKTLINECCGIKTYVTKVSKFDFVTEKICPEEKDHNYIKKNGIEFCSKCDKKKDTTK